MPLAAAATSAGVLAASTRSLAPRRRALIVEPTVAHASAWATT